MIISSNNRKGVNIQEFLAKRKAVLTKKAIKPQEFNQEKKNLPIKQEKEVEKINPARIKLAKITPKTHKIEKSNMFKFVNVEKIRNPLKLLEFIEWCAKPHQERIPKTQNEVATKLGVDINTLSEWKKRIGFWDEVTIYRNQFFRKFTSSVYYGLAQRAKTGDPKAVELYASLFENYKKGMKVEDTTPERIITDEEREKINHALKNIGLASIIKHNEESESNDNAN